MRAVDGGSIDAASDKRDTSQRGSVISVAVELGHVVGRWHGRTHLILPQQQVTLPNKLVADGFGGGFAVGTDLIEQLPGWRRW